MEHIDNIYILGLILVVVAGLYFYFMQPTKPKLLPASEAFVPAPATVVKMAEPMPVPREVSPSGPSPPNARIPEAEAKKHDVYMPVPNDPQDEQYGSQDIQDNLRYPERLFGPGVVNGGNKVLQESEVAGQKTLGTVQPIQPFSPELALNGALIDGIGPDDTQTNPNFASF